MAQDGKKVGITIGSFAGLILIVCIMFGIRYLLEQHRIKQLKENMENGFTDNNTN